MLTGAAYPAIPGADKPYLCYRLDIKNLCGKKTESTASD